MKRTSFRSPHIETGQRFLITISPQSTQFLRTMNKSFPPADDMISIITKIDWAMVSNVTLEGLDYFLHIIEVCVVYVAAFCQASYVMWQRHSVTDKIANAAQVSYTWMIQVALPYVITTGLWMRDVAYPEARQSTLNAYTFTKATWETVSDLYNLITARQFTIL